MQGFKSKFYHCVQSQPIWMTWNRSFHSFSFPLMCAVFWYGDNNWVLNSVRDVIILGIIYLTLIYLGIAKVEVSRFLGTSNVKKQCTLQTMYINLTPFNNPIAYTGIHLIMSIVMGLLLANENWKLLFNGNYSHIWRKHFNGGCNLGYIFKRHWLLSEV